jgi:hypothetical protein
MNRNTLLWLAALGAGYYFLTTRTPVYLRQTDGSFIPASMIDRLSVALTGAIPPAPQPSNAQVIIGAINQAIQPGGATT